MSARSVRVSDTQLRRRKLIGTIALGFFVAATLAALAVLAILVGDTLRDGASWLDWGFIRDLPSRRPERAGIWPALVGTVWIMILTAAFTFPNGVGAAIYLEEFGGTGRLARRSHHVWFCGYCGFTSSASGARTRRPKRSLASSRFTRWPALV